MTQLDTARFQSTDRYIAYLETTEGKLRLDLGWMNLREFLPTAATTEQALDVGSGTGPFAFRLAELGFTVDLLDVSDAMLAVAREQAHDRGLSHRTSFHHGDGRSLWDLFEPSSFDVVVCHNVLEYQEEPLAALRGLAHVLKKDGKSVASVLVRNRHGEVLKAAIKSNDCALAESVLTADTVLESLYGEPVRVFDPTDLRSMMKRAGLRVVAERGVRVVSDYMDCAALANGDYTRLQKLELLLGAKPEFAAIARYTQFIARASARSSGAQL
ncbi:MAG: methyltransferase domain-containing protein [Terriglobales bacterium]